MPIPIHQPLPILSVGWIENDSLLQAVIMANWVMEEEIRNLQFTLVGFLKPYSGGERKVEYWLQATWGKVNNLLLFSVFLSIF